MQVSVIVPAFNEAKLIAQSLRSVRAALRVFAERGWSAELIVCDNNSTDRTAELAAAEGARVVFEPVNQIARARNAGARAAGGDWLIFIDADSHPSPELFADVASAIGSGHCLGGGSTVLMEGGGRLARFGVRGWNLISRLKKWAAGSFLFCEAEAFRRVGGFSQELYASEEIDLSERLKALARERRRKFVILHRHRLVTSGRKLRLYTLSEHLRFLAKTIFQRGRTLRSSQECFTWYDGRR